LSVSHTPTKSMPPNLGGGNSLLALFAAGRPHSSCVSVIVFYTVRRLQGHDIMSRNVQSHRILQKPHRIIPSGCTLQ
jgi:hypothetical protein